MKKKLKTLAAKVKEKEISVEDLDDSQAISTACAQAIKGLKKTLAEVIPAKQIELQKIVDQCNGEGKKSYDES